MATKLLVVVVYPVSCFFDACMANIHSNPHFFWRLTSLLIHELISDSVPDLLKLRGAKGSVHWLLAYTAFVVPSAQYITRSTAVSLCTGVGCISHPN